MSDVKNQQLGLEILEKCYTSAIEGLPTSDSAKVIGEEYLRKYGYDKDLAIEKLVNAQIMKCATTGFLTSVGGALTLPVAISTDVGVNVYVQLRMIASIAVIGGYNPTDDEVKTLAYMCLVGMASTDIVKNAGIKVGEKVTINMLKKIPGKLLTKINQMVGFRLITKMGTKGVINLIKVIPGVSGVIGGSIDAVATKNIADRAKNCFIYGKGL
ncbi:MAG: EcsC family protein [Oscillospiraceae bacterium]